MYWGSSPNQHSILPEFNLSFSLSTFRFVISLIFCSHTSCNFFPKFSGIESFSSTVTREKKSSPSARDAMVLTRVVAALLCLLSTQHAAHLPIQSHTTTKLLLHWLVTNCFFSTWCIEMLIIINLHELQAFPFRMKPIRETTEVEMAQTSHLGNEHARQKGKCWLLSAWITLSYVLCLMLPYYFLPSFFPIPPLPFSPSLPSPPSPHAGGGRDPCLPWRWCLRRREDASQPLVY